MRKELEFRRADAEKIEQAKALIEQIGSGDEEEQTVQDALDRLGQLTGRRHEQAEFVQYWGWTDLDGIAEQAFLQPPYVEELTREELIEMIERIQKAAITCQDNEMMYYEEILHKSLPLTDVDRYIRCDKDSAQIADEMLAAARSNVISL